MESDPNLHVGPLPAGIRSRFVDNHNGCTMHVLDAGFGEPGRPCVVLLHGFPELAFSWRHQLLALAKAGYHAVAPDLRGYGRSGGTDVAYDDDLLPYSYVSRVADTLGLLRALGHERAAAVVGHDYGSLVAGWCALLRPDVFRAVAMMSAPFRGAPPLPLGEAQSPRAPNPAELQAALAALPRPRKHYMAYYATREANAQMWRCEEGVHAFLRAYFHMKSGDHAGARPHALAGFSADEFAKLPTYYVMDQAATMPETVRPAMPSPEVIGRCGWLPDDVLAVYSGEFARTGFQGGLQGYRVNLDPRFATELRAFAGRRVEVPAAFISGALDWGNHQVPGGLELMRETCPRMSGPRFIEGAGHWVQQERPAEVNSALLDFLRALD